jgi:hypothetical protein
MASYETKSASYSRWNSHKLYCPYWLCLSLNKAEATLVKSERDITPRSSSMLVYDEAWLPKWREDHATLPYSLKRTVPRVRGHVTRTKMNGIRLHCHSPHLEHQAAVLDCWNTSLMISTLDCHPQDKACEVLSGGNAHAYISMRWYQGIKRGQANSRIPLRCAAPRISCSAPTLNESMWIGK